MEPVVHRPGATADETLRAVADVHGDREAYVETGGDRLTFAEWDAAADGTAAALAELGVREGDVVALLLPSSADYAICYQAAMRLGAITSGINPRLGPTEVASILRRSRPSVVIGPRPWLPGSATRPDVDTTVVDRAELPVVAHARSTSASPDAGPDTASGGRLDEWDDR